MNRKTGLWIVSSLSMAWAVAFVAGFLAIVLSLGEVRAPGEGNPATFTFIFLQLMAASFAVSAAVVASGMQSQTIRKIAQVPMAGTGLIVLVGVSLAVISKAFT